MDADGRRFHLLLGEGDWRGLAAEPGAPGPHWDGARQTAGLPPIIQQLRATPGERLLVAEQRRAAAADAFGNIYAVADDLLSLAVTSAGSRTTTRFWPVAAGKGRGPELFTPTADAAPLPTPGRFAALTVLDCAWLLAARVEAGGEVTLLLFDLLGGGGPIEHELGLSDPVAPGGLELATTGEGGFALLDRAARRLWRFDRTLSPLTEGPAPAPAPELFQPAAAGEARESRKAPLPQGLDLASFAPDPLALSPWGEHLLLLDRSGDIHALAGDGRRALLAATGPGAHTLLVAQVTTTDDPAAERLLVVRENGNQAFAWRLPETWDEEAVATAEHFPLRRFGGRALLAVRGFARYDGLDGAWLPVVQMPLRRFVPEAAALAPPFDCGAPGTVWDRVVIDGCIPPGTLVEVWVRGFDEPELGAGGAVESSAAFVAQPRPLLGSGRVDLPWHAARALPAADRALGRGSHSLLLQGVRGRFCQLRLRLSGDGSASPQLRALRAWSPRVSWVERHLPAIYRSEPTAFLDRFLANFEGEYRLLEERVAGMQRVFDPATAPAEALTWLADWFDCALDPSWDEPRRRLFIAHAERFFRWRGTRRGLLMGLRLAFDPCVDARLFDEVADERAGGIRIIETFYARAIGSLAAGDPGGAFVPQPTGARWTPAEGNAGLARRFRGEDEGDVPAAQVALFDEPELAQALGFFPSGAGERLRWCAFQRSQGRAEAGLADLPRDADGDPLWPAFLTLHSAERERWQRFLAGRYRRIGRLNAAYGTGWERFEHVSLPDHLPETAAAQADWFDFESKLLPTAAAAHRFIVLLPIADVNADPAEADQKMRLAQRIVALEKPAHTSFSVRFFWAMNRVGEARLGSDTLLGQGSRAPELLPHAIVGRAHLGASFVGPDGPRLTADRRRLAC